MEQPPAPRLFALVPCAGTGTRAAAGQPKQYVLLAGRAVVAHTLQALAQVHGLGGLLVVLAPEDALFEAAVPGFANGMRWVARCGGATRAETVRAGLAELRTRGALDEDWVLVHDAARCLLRAAWVDRLVQACRDDPVGGLLALPLADTLKQSRGDRARSTVPRAEKWTAQTPQMFRLGLLDRALRADTAGFTDESGAIEALGLEPRLVTGEWENLKVTFPADFSLAERLLASREASGPIAALSEPFPPARPACA